MEISAKPIDVCEEVQKYMTSLEFTEEQITKVIYSPLYVDARNKNSEQQKAVLSLLFFRILTSNPDHNPPTNVRLSLNSSNNVRNWLDNIHLTVLPYMKNFNLI